MITLETLASAPVPGGRDMPWVLAEAPGWTVSGWWAAYAPELKLGEVDGGGKPGDLARVLASIAEWKREAMRFAVHENLSFRIDACPCSACGCAQLGQRVFENVSGQTALQDKIGRLFDGYSVFRLGGNGPRDMLGGYDGGVLRVVAMPYLDIKAPPVKP